MILPPFCGAVVEWDLNVIYTEGHVDILIGCVMGGFNAADIIEDTVHHVIYHIIGKVFVDQHNVIYKNALHILLIIISIGGDYAGIY